MTSTLQWTLDTLLQNNYEISIENIPSKKNTNCATKWCEWCANLPESQKVLDDTEMMTIGFGVNRQETTTTTAAAAIAVSKRQPLQVCTLTSSHTKMFEMLKIVFLHPLLFMCNLFCDSKPPKYII